MFPKYLKFTAFSKNSSASLMLIIKPTRCFNFSNLFCNKTVHVSGSSSVHHQRNCPKHVEFYSKNKFEKLMHLVGFIIRIYHDARSPKRQKS